MPTFKTQWPIRCVDKTCDLLKAPENNEKDQHRVPIEDRDPEGNATEVPARPGSYDGEIGNSSTKGPEV